MPLNSDSLKVLLDYFAKTVGIRGSMFLIIIWTMVSVLTSSLNHYAGALTKVSGVGTLRGYEIESGEFSVSRSELNTEGRDWPLDHVGPAPEKAANERPFKYHVKFHKQFDRPPNVIPTIRHLDLSTEHNIRLNIKVVDVTNSECDLVLKTWNRSIVSQIVIRWIALERPALSPAK